jgi:hypothetical protein
MGFRQPAIHLEIETVHTDRSPWFPAKQLEERHHHCTQNLGPVGTPVAIVYIPIAGWSNHVLGGLDSLKNMYVSSGEKMECLWNGQPASCSSNHIQIELHEHCIQTRSWAIQENYTTND